MQTFGFTVFCSILLVCSGLIETTRGEDVCQNGGEPLTGRYRKCAFSNGFKGYDCSQKVTPCEAKPCRNLATCENKDDGTFTCTCRENYEGILCEKKVLPCDRNPCKNGGNCTDDGVKCFRCECPDGSKGSDCSEKISLCEVSPCLNGDECSNKEGGGFKCMCKKGYTGLLCDQKSSLFSSVILEGNTDYLEQLDTSLGGEKNWKLCYRSSRDGFTSSAFHSHCDNKGPTITLVRSNNYIFGGYADLASGGSGRYMTTTNSFIFSLRNKDNLKPFKSPVYRNSGNAVYTNPNYGPTFGGAHDLYIANGANANTNSYTNLGYTYRPP